MKKSSINKLEMGISNCKNLIVVVLFFVFSSVKGQKDEQKLNSVFAELGGTGILYSINYERLVPLNSHFGLSLSSGFSTIPFSPLIPTLPVQVKVYGKIKGNHFIDFGTAAIIWKFDADNSINTDIFLQIGYKYSFKNDKYYLGIAFTPGVYGNLNGVDFYPWGAIRFGYKFNLIEKMKLSEHQKSENYKIQNLSATVGFINTKIRIQYEKAWGLNTSYGVGVTGYLSVYEFPGLKIEPFIRHYAKKYGNKEGFFVQGKVGAGYLLSGLYRYPEEIELFGLTYGGGVAGGYKLKLGNHLTLESILGVHWYAPPVVNYEKDNDVIQSRNEDWYSTTGFPLDFQLKLGWQY